MKRFVAASLVLALLTTAVAGAPDLRRIDGYIGFVAGSNPTCASGNYYIWANSTDLKLKKCENGALADLDTTGGGANHNLLSATHPDTTAAAVARGDLVVGQTATPSWARLALGALGRYLRSDGTDLGYSAVAAGGAGACTNQFVRATNDNALPTCATVGNLDLAAAAVDSAKLATANKTEQITYTFFDTGTDLPATLDVPSIFPNRSRAITLTEVYCEIDAGTASINLQRDDGTPANILSADLACSTAGATSTGFVAGEDAITVGQNIDHVTVSVGAGLRRLNVAVKYTVN